MSAAFPRDLLFTPHSDSAVLQMPLSGLVAQADEELRRIDLFRQAARSAVYRKKWQAAGVRLEKLRSREDLRRLPFIDGADLVAMNASGRSLKDGLVNRPRAWVVSRGSAGSRKWLPLTLNDIAHWFARIRRVNELLRPALEKSSEPVASRRWPGSTMVLAINESMPRVTNAVPYLWERVDYLTGGARLEMLIVTMEMLPRNHWDRFALKKEPQWLMASVQDALKLAQHLREQAGPDSRSPLLPSLTSGLFWGAPLESPQGARAELAGVYGLSEMFSLYFSAECREMYAECPAHAGLHLWMDGAVHEIIPEEKRGENGRQPETVFVDQAPPGACGEYVVTTFNEALPLVRYRTGDRLQVVGNGPCACGLTHPRVLFLGQE